MRVCAWIVVIGVCGAAAVPASGGDLDRLLLIGEPHEGEDAAQALDRLIREDHFRIATKTLGEVVHADVGDDELEGLAKIAAVARDHARRWWDGGIHHKHGFALVKTVYEIAEAVWTRKAKDSVDANLAYADALAAYSFERMNRREPVKFKEAFGAGSKACMAAAAIDPARTVDCTLHAAMLLRIGAPRERVRRMAVLQEAAALLDTLGEEHDGPRVTAQRARMKLAQAIALLDHRKKSEAKAMALAGLALVSENKTEAPEVSGAYNDLVDVATVHKWRTGTPTFVTASATKGGYTFDLPQGSGWVYANERDLKGKGHFLLERRRADGAWIELGLASFSADLTYGEGDVPGGKPKAISQLTKQVLSSTMRKPKSGRVGKGDIPDGFKFVTGYSLTGKSSGGAPMTVFCWTCRPANGDDTIVISVIVRGAVMKSLPPQTRAILQSVAVAK